MDDEALAQFQMVTSADLSKAQQYLQVSNGDVQQAVELYFNTGGADLLNDTPSAPSASTSTPPIPRPSETSQSEREVIQIDSDDEGTPAVAPGGPSVEDDEAMARRLQEEMYGVAPGGNTAEGGGVDQEGYRAPIARTTETLVGGPGYDDYDLNDPQDRESAILQQLRAREQARLTSRRRGPPGIFNQQRSGPSIWNEDSTDHEARHTRLAQATGGASTQSSKASQLAEMYSPPFDIMARVGWDQARSEGKEQLKWLLVNVQDTSVFDCQILNRDLWKHDGIKETIRENFIFLQYSKDDAAAEEYTRWYFKDKDVQDSYPHIAIVDPRTGEQVKVWSGPPAPKAMEFLMQLHEFLDRYSLEVTAKNPVARRKPEERRESQIDRMTEDQQLEWALKHSVDANSSGAAGAATRAADPDDLTRSVGDLRGTAATEGGGDSEMGDATEPSIFSTISSTSTHTEPDPATPSTRIQFRHSGGRIVRRFAVADTVRRIYEWLKASPVDGRSGQEFELVSMGKNLIGFLDQTIEEAGLKNGTVMVEYPEN